MVGTDHVTLTCSVCGYALDVKRVALMVDGRYLAEYELCAVCRMRLLDAVEQATDYRKDVPR